MLHTVRITSRDNASLKYVRRVRDGRENGAMFVEGVRLCEEALRSNIHPSDCFVSAKALRNERVEAIATAAIAMGIKIHEVSEDLFRSIADTDSPQGVLMTCDRPDATRTSFEKHFKLSTGQIPVVVYLEEAGNPSNLGAITRTGEAAGAIGIIISKRSADPFSPKALRSSMGSVFRIPIWFGTGFGEALDWARERKLLTTAADVAGETSYTELDWRIPRLLVFGSEAHGLDEAALKGIDNVVRIPIDPQVESLNLAVSAGIILFEARRQTTS